MGRFYRILVWFGLCFLLLGASDKNHHESSFKGDFDFSIEQNTAKKSIDIEALDLGSPDFEERIANPGTTIYILASRERETVLAIPEGYVDFPVLWSNEEFNSYTDESYFEKYSFDDFKGKSRILVLALLLPDLVPAKFARKLEGETEEASDEEVWQATKNYVSLNIQETSVPLTHLTIERFQENYHFEHPGRKLFGLNDMGRRMIERADGELIVGSTNYNYFFWPAEWDEPGGLYITCLMDIPNTRCQVKRDLTENIILAYQFSRDYLPRWKEIDTKIVTFVKSLIIEEREMLQNSN